MIVYDANNWVRVQLETDFTGLGMRLCWSEATKQDNELRIFAFDGVNANALRHAFYPEYKMTRKLPQDSFFENLTFFKELLRNAPANVAVAEKQGYEGDDVIHTLCKMFSNSPKPITIMSTDKDLTAIPNTVLPMANQEFCQKKYVRLYKTLVGDPSDNIKGVKGFGKGSWDKLTDMDKEDLLRWFESGLSDELTLSVNPKLWDVIRRQPEDELKKNWIITGFFDVPNLELKFGDGHTEIAEQKLKELLI